MAPSESPPDTTGWPLREAERILSEAGIRWSILWTAWTGRLPVEAGARPEGGPWVLAQRMRGVRDVVLVVARFAYDARGCTAAGGPAAGDDGSPAREGG